MERLVREQVRARCTLWGSSHLHSDLGVLLAEYDRRGAVEKAAAAYVMACLCDGGSGIAELDRSLDETFAALCEAVRTNGEFRG